MTNSRTKFLALSALVPLVFLISAFFTIPSPVFAATSPSLGAAGSYSVLGHETVTCTGATNITGNVGVSTGTSITGFPGPCTVNPGTTQSNTQSAIDAQADNLSAFGTLDQGCDYNYADGQDLTLLSPLVPGVYCSAGSFLLTKNLNLTGSGVWIFKTVSGLTTSTGSSVTGGDPCNVWWRVGSSATLETTTSFIGNILALTSVWLRNGATLNGRALAQTGEVTLDANTISGPTCAGAATNPTPVSTPTPAPNSSSSTTSSNSNSGGSSSSVCPVLNYVTPNIIESRRVSPTSIFISWGPYSGTDTFNIQYGTENGKWLYSTTVTGFSTTINALPANLPIWVRIAATDNCSVGNFGGAKLTGEGMTSTGQVLGASTLASTGSSNSKLGLMLVLLGTGITLVSFYALKKSSF